MTGAVIGAATGGAFHAAARGASFIRRGPQCFVAGTPVHIPYVVDEFVEQEFAAVPPHDSGFERSEIAFVAIAVGVSGWLASRYVINKAKSDSSKREKRMNLEDGYDLLPAF